MMIKKLSRHGNSDALIIDKVIQELMGITPKSDLEIQVKPGVLTVRHHNGSPDESRFNRLLKKHGSRYRKAFEELSK